MRGVKKKIESITKVAHSHTNKAYCDDYKNRTNQDNGPGRRCEVCFFPLFALISFIRVCTSRAPSRASSYWSTSFAFAPSWSSSNGSEATAGSPCVLLNTTSDGSFVILLRLRRRHPVLNQSESNVAQWAVLNDQFQNKFRLQLNLNPKWSCLKLFSYPDLLIRSS